MNPAPPLPIPLASPSGPQPPAFDRKERDGSGGRRVLMGVGYAVILLVLAAAGAAAVFFLSGDPEADAARADVKAVGEEVASWYTAAEADPIVMVTDAGYVVGPTVVGLTALDPSLAFYPGAGSFCVVLTLATGASYSYGAAEGPVDGSCAPAGAEPVGPVIDAERDLSLPTSPYWFDLAVGECVANDVGAVTAPTAPSQGPLTEPTRVACTEMHAGEVYVIARVARAAAPGEAEFRADVNAVCEGPAFTDFVGKPYLDSSLFYSVLYPSDATWEAGSGEMVCLLTDGGAETTGSLRGSGR